MALPMVKEQKKAAGAALSGLTVGGLICILYFLAELMVMGPHVTALMRVACMDLVRAIQITEYLHRFESFMVGLWYWSMLVQAGFLTYCATLACRQTMGLKEQNKWPVIAAGIIMVVLTYATAFNRVYFLNYLEHGWQYIALPVQLGLPLFLLFFSLFSKKQ